MSAQNEIRVERIGLATLYLADCMKVLPTLDRVDACITDPPYGIGASKQSLGKGAKNFDRCGDWDASPPVVGCFLEAGAAVCLWGGNYFSDQLPPTNDWLIWHKVNDGRSFSECEMAWTNFGRQVRHLSHHWAGEEKLHPTMKPLAVMKWCIDQAGNPQTILDPFAGSGTTGVAALEMGLKFIGIEREPKYFEIMCERIQRVVDAPPLFPFSCDTTGRGTQDSQACLLPLLNQIGEKV